MKEAFERALEAEMVRIQQDIARELERGNPLFYHLPREDEMYATAMLYGGPLDGVSRPLLCHREGDAPGEWCVVDADRVAWYTRVARDVEAPALYAYEFSREERR